MPMFQEIIRHLNRQFDQDHIQAFAKLAHEFAPGRKLNVDLLRFRDAALARRFQAYLDSLPDALQEMLRCVINHALSAQPPIPVSFSWAPAYDYEMTVWAPECGILVQFKGPNPRGAEAA